MRAPFSVLVVRDDGSRVHRLHVPRWIAQSSLGLVAAMAAATAGVSGEYVFLKQQSGHVAAVERRLDDDRQLIESFQTRLAAIRQEIVTWKTLHAKMWEPFGPEAMSGESGTGVGGAGPDDEPASDENPPLSRELDLLAATVAEEGPRVRELEHVISHTAKIVNALPLQWPIHGHVNSEYGPRRSPWTGVREHHGGIDIGSPPGTPVKCPAAGTVVEAASWGDYGTHVTLDHGNGVRSIYGHLQKLEVKTGQKVERGQVLGLVGSTGRSTGPHLHYEILVQGNPVDPRGFLWER